MEDDWMRFRAAQVNNIVHVFGEGYVAFYAAPNPFLLNKIFKLIIGVCTQETPKQTLKA